MRALTARRYRLFLRAWLAVVPHLWRRVGFLRGLRSAAFVVAELRLPFDVNLWLRRQRGCRRCPIYNAGLHTCGTPGHGFTSGPEEGQQIGCLCVMPVKSISVGAKCWLYVKGYVSVGWSPELNG